MLDRKQLTLPLIRIEKANIILGVSEDKEKIYILKARYCAGKTSIINDIAKLFEPYGCEIITLTNEEMKEE